MKVEQYSAQAEFATGQSLLQHELERPFAMHPFYSFCTISRPLQYIWCFSPVILYYSYDYARQSTVVRRLHLKKNIRCDSSSWLKYFIPRKNRRLLLLVNWDYGFSNTHGEKDQMQNYEVLSAIREIVAVWWLDGISAMSDTTHLLSGRSSQRAGNLFTSLSSFSCFCFFSLFFQLLHNGSPYATCSFQNLICFDCMFSSFSS